MIHFTTYLTNNFSHLYNFLWTFFSWRNLKNKYLNPFLLEIYLLPWPIQWKFIISWSISFAMNSNYQQRFNCTVYILYTVRGTREIVNITFSGQAWPWDAYWWWSVDVDTVKYGSMEFTTQSVRSVESLALLVSPRDW